MSELAKALAAAQAEFPPIERSREVKVQTKTGGSYTFSYAPLDAILSTVRPVLAKHGLAFSQMLTENADTPALRTLLLHESGDSLQGVCPLPVTPGMSAQEFGSLVTYFRRYALVAALGIASEEDDDGNAASGNTISKGDSIDRLIELSNKATKPSEMPIHFGKNNGVLLGSLTARQLDWYANTWTIQDDPSEYDYRLKAAALALAGGDDSEIKFDPDHEIPF